MKINCWTSNKPICGLRHFVLVNKTNENHQINFLMVSVIDVEISFKISKDELLNGGIWNEGWLNLPKSESITKDYFDLKSNKNFKEDINKVFINNDSLFNIP